MISKRPPAGAVCTAAVVLLCIVTAVLFESNVRFETALRGLLPNLSLGQGLSNWEGSRGVSLTDGPPPAVVFTVGRRTPQPLITQLLSEPQRFTHLHVSAGIMAETIVPGDGPCPVGRVLVRMIGRDGARLWAWPSAVAAVSGTAGWRQYGTVIPVHPDAAAVRLFVCLGAAEGRMTVRDIEVDAVSESRWFAIVRIALIVLWAGAMAGIAVFAAVRTRRYRATAMALLAGLVIVAGVTAERPRVAAVAGSMEAGLVWLFASQATPESVAPVEPFRQSAVERIRTGGPDDLADRIAYGYTTALVLQIFIFALLALLVCFGFRGTPWRWLLLYLLAAALAAEIVQYFTGTRSVAVAGAASNAAGAALGVLLYSAWTADHPIRTSLRRYTPWAAYGLVAAFVLVEAAFWLILPLPDPFDESTEDSVAVKQNLPGLKPEIRYVRNSFGFRSLSLRSHDKGERTIRIIALGASTTDQPTQNTEDMWSALLEGKLKAHFAGRDVGIEVAAWGRGGDRVVQRVLRCERSLGRLRPDIAVVLEGINDLTWNGGASYWYDRGVRIRNVRQIRQKAARPDWRRGLRMAVTSVSQVTRRIGVARQQFATGDAVTAGRAIEWSSRNLPELREKYRQLPRKTTLERTPDPIVEFADGIRMLVACLKRHGSAVLLLGQPTLWRAGMSRQEQAALWMAVSTADGPVRPTGAWLDREISRYNGVQRALARRMSAQYLDLDDRIPRTLDMFFDDVHFTDAGSRRVADSVFPMLRDMAETVARRRGLVSRGSPGGRP